jgi:hypothetical protein
MPLFRIAAVMPDGHPTVGGKVRIPLALTPPR